MNFLLAEPSGGLEHGMMSQGAHMYETHEYGFLACMYVCLPYACLMATEDRGKKRIDPLGLELQNYEPQCGCRELNPGQFL